MNTFKPATEQHALYIKVLLAKIQEIHRDGTMLHRDVTVWVSGGPGRRGCAPDL